MTPTNERQPLLSTQDLAAYLNVPIHTVRKWRMTGAGPEGSKVGKFVRYRQEDVDSWLASTRSARAHDSIHYGPPGATTYRGPRSET